MAGRGKKSNKDNFEKIKKEMAEKKKKAQGQQKSANPEEANKAKVSIQAENQHGEIRKALVEPNTDSGNAEKDLAKKGAGPVIEDKQDGIKAADTNKTELVVFQVDGEQFGLRISNVKEIIRIPEITKAPEMPHYVLGVCNLRGNLLPVIDCRKLLGMSEGELNESSRVIVADINGRNAGLVADRVLEVINVEEASVKAPPASIKGIKGGAIDGILVLDEGRRVVMILNADKVIMEENYELSLNTQNKPLEDLPVLETKLEEEQIVIFSVGNAEYAFNIGCVREIIRLPEITKVPNTASFVEGVYSIRNQVMAVISLGKLLGVNLEKPDGNSRVIIVDTGNLAYGVIVDKVSQVVRVQRDSFRDMGMESGLNGADCVKGFFSFDNGRRLVMLLDPGRLVSVEDIKAVYDTGYKKDETGNTVLSGNTDISYEYVVFKLCDEEYGIDINNVQEVNRINGIARFPGAPEFIDGMTDLRGELIPILNLRKLFNAGESRGLENSKLLVAEFENRNIGIMIDSVSGVLKFSGSSLEDARNTLHGYDKNRYIKKIAKLNDGKRIVLILDLSTLLSFM